MKARINSFSLDYGYSARVIQFVVLKVVSDLILILIFQ